ncbi:hypothetical protein G6O67_006028 [Ophiocordyceps sinensis]|uniref:Uncharacterized protein n=1 Tax=Ophiocordyceps sinensis TaxID=72228 RepID=A0A8H4PNM2_9HYPO|nr:hypothetical protein G6O67_006028 [Ophiocordyceps sinensis]
MGSSSLLSSYSADLVALFFSQCKVARDFFVSPRGLPAHQSAPNPRTGLPRFAAVIEPLPGHGDADQRLELCVYRRTKAVFGWPRGLESHDKGPDERTRTLLRHRAWLRLAATMPEEAHRVAKSHAAWRASIEEQRLGTTPCPVV